MTSAVSTAVGKEVDGTGEHGWLQKVMYVLIAVLGIYICCKGGRLLLQKDSVRQGIESNTTLSQSLEDAAARTYIPGYTAVVERKNQSGWLAGFMEPLLPVYSYLAEQKSEEEDGQTDEAGSGDVNAGESRSAVNAEKNDGSAEADAGDAQNAGMSEETDVNPDADESQYKNTNETESAVMEANADEGQAESITAPENDGHLVSEAAAGESQESGTDTTDDGNGGVSEASAERAQANDWSDALENNTGEAQSVGDYASGNGEQVLTETEASADESQIEITDSSEHDMSANLMENDAEQQAEIQDSSDEVLEASSAGSSYLSDKLLTEQVRDFDYLLSNYYTVDADTTIDDTLLDADDLLTEDLSIEQNPDVPQILIYHTHSQETFADSVEGDVGTTIVGMGSVLAELLRTKYGYQVIHDTGVYDLVDGVLDRSKAYDYARESVQNILEEYPTIEVVIDLHRDGVDGQKFVTEIDGKKTSMVMFFNGLSQDENGEPLTWLDNPYVADNLAFSLQLQLLAREQYPGYTRNIYLKAQRYNLHLLPRSLLVEAGTQLNTVEEETNAMEPLADLLAQVLNSN